MSGDNHNQADPPAIDLTLPRQALSDHRGPRFVTRETEVGTDGKTYPVAWTAHCRCGAVTDAYEDHLLEVISLAAIVSAMEVSS